MSVTTHGEPNFRDLHPAASLSLVGCATTTPASTPTPARPVPSSGPDRDKWTADFAVANGLLVNEAGAKAFQEGTCRRLEQETSTTRPMADSQEPSPPECSS